MLIAFSLIFAAILFLSIFNSKMNAGIPALVVVLFAVPLIPDSNVGRAATLFPTSLFLTLLGVTFFFTTLNSTGLIDNLLQRILRLFGPFPRLLPIVLFIIVAALTALGLGNIATIALLAPLGIPLARQIGMSSFMMTLLLVGAANAASFSPLTLPGIFTNEFIQNSDVLRRHMQPSTMRWWIFWTVFFCISFTTIISFFVLGGRKWLNRISTPPTTEHTADDSVRLNRQQKLTALLAAVLAVLFLLGCVLSLQFWEQLLNPQFLLISRRLSDVGLIGWLGSLLMIIFGLAEPEKNLKNVPWATLILVCGMSTYIELLSRLGLPDAIAALVQQNIATQLLPAAFAAASALLSAFSSSVGVALPVFMPIVQSIAQSIETSLVHSTTIAVAVGSHLVDASPLSTLGALCLAQIRDTQEQSSTYRALLIYSFCMIPVAAVVCFLLSKTIF
ncbi:MAG: hypothetical protein RLZZ488_630 [Pseudomonadota bacterium]